MSRMVSFIVLLCVLLGIGVLFFKVMSGFLLPLFLAVLLVVMFRPLHEWFRRKLPNHRRLAAAGTTVSILLVFLIPLLFICFEAGREAMAFFKSAQAAQSKPAVHKTVHPRSDDQKTGNDADDSEDLGAAEYVQGVLADKLDELNQRYKLNLDVEAVHAEIFKRAQEWLAPMLLATTQYTIGLVIGLCIMVISLYYFLLDGSSMVNTVMRLSPLDDRYESQLIEEFDRTSRAVVLASVVSAVAQGILSGIGYYVAGLDAVFLLTMLTMLFAMVPFIGAAAIWVPCCIWLFWSGHTTAAILLGVYGMLIVSMVDNVIKPYILHGRSNLHPLLALLSVLGGVKVLGPIGIFVGPMAVTFLHAVLVMFQHEIDLMGEEPEEKVATSEGVAK